MQKFKEGTPVKVYTILASNGACYKPTYVWSDGYIFVREMLGPRKDKTAIVRKVGGIFDGMEFRYSMNEIKAA